MECGTLPTMSTDRESRKRRLTIYTTDEVVTSLESLARREERSVSEMAHMVIRYYLRDLARRERERQGN